MQTWLLAFSLFFASFQEWNPSDFFQFFWRLEGPVLCPWAICLLIIQSLDSVGSIKSTEEEHKEISFSGKNKKKQRVSGK